MTFVQAQLDARAEGRAEGMAEGIAVGKAEGKMELLISLVKNKIAPIEYAAAEANMSKEEFEALIKVAK